MTFVPSCIYIPVSIIVHKSTFSGTKVLFTFTEQSWLHVANSDFEFGFQSNPWILDKWAAIYCTGDVPSCTEKCRKKHWIPVHIDSTEILKQAFHLQNIIQSCSHRLTLMSQILSSPSWVVANIFSDSLFHFTW